MLATVLSACAGPPPPVTPPLNSELPVELRASPNQHLDEVLTATGQIRYVCRGPVHGLQWTREGTVATLFDSSHRRVGTIAPGGYFIADDHSYLVARDAASVQISANDLAWSRLASRFNADGGALPNPGRFSLTSLIQVVQTTGGLAPSFPCAHPGGSQPVPYSATYMIYRNATGDANTGVQTSSPVP
jgi:hypothetical protein